MIPSLNLGKPNVNVPQPPLNLLHFHLCLNSHDPRITSTSTILHVHSHSLLRLNNHHTQTSTPLECFSLTFILSLLLKGNLHNHFLWPMAKHNHSHQCSRLLQPTSLPLPLPLPLLPFHTPSRIWKKILINVAQCYALNLSHPTPLAHRPSEWRWCFWSE